MKKSRTWQGHRRRGKAQKHEISHDRLLQHLVERHGWRLAAAGYYWTVIEHPPTGRRGELFQANRPRSRYSPALWAEVRETLQLTDEEVRSYALQQ